MNLRQLEAFRATLRIGSVTGAAKQLTLSQPSVTRLVKDLERSVGFPLFVRSGRGLVATVEGRRFGDAVEGMFAGTDKLKETANSITVKHASATSRLMECAVHVPDASRLPLSKSTASCLRHHSVFGGRFFTVSVSRPTF